MAAFTPLTLDVEVAADNESGSPTTSKREGLSPAFSLRVSGGDTLPLALLSAGGSCVSLAKRTKVSRVGTGTGTFLP
jgi:hypothetical protein